MSDAEPFVIDSEARADWLLAKLAAIDAERERITANTARRDAELGADRECLLRHFGDQLTAWAKIESERRGRKTVTLPQGVVSFRTVPARFTVTDEAEALHAARLACPAAVRVETVSRLDRRALLDYVEATGDVLPGVDRIPARESASITPGIRKGEAE